MFWVCWRPWRSDLLRTWPLPQDKEALKLDLPKPMFVGTPKNIVSDHLDPNTGKDRPAFMVPKGVTNVAAGKAVSASDEEPIIGELEMLTDGDKEGADGSFVEFGPGVQWVQVDLGAPVEIFAIAAWHYHSQARLYHDVIVRVSDDKDFIKYTEAVQQRPSTTPPSSASAKTTTTSRVTEGKLIDGKGTKGQYVRLYSNGNTSNDMNHVIEVEVFGK